MGAPSTIIQLHGRGGSVDVAADRVYFAFASGRLTYQCDGCGECCRGHNYLLDRSDVLHQIAIRPHLRFFLDDLADRRETEMRNFKPGCFFLDADGLCSIQKSDGYAAKPETCRLFPFNNFRAVGKFLVVAPHTSLCPLQVVRGDARSEQSSHQALLDEMAVRGVANGIRRCSGIDGDADAAISLEREIVALSEEYGSTTSYRAFAAAQLRAGATRRPLASDPEDGLDLSSAIHEMDLFARRIADVLGVEASALSAPDSSVDELMIALTPVLRSELVFREPASADADCLKIVDQRNAAKLMLLVYMFTSLACRSGIRSVTYQTATKLLRNFHATLLLLVNVDAVVGWRHDAKIDLSIPPSQMPYKRAFMRIAQELARAETTRQRQPLGDLLCEHNTWDGVERVGFVKFVAQRLHGQIRPIDERSARMKLPQRLRSELRRWAMARLA
jgi:Fe-S-cluster containining protein